MKAIALIALAACTDSPSPDAAALKFCVQETNRYRTTVPSPGTGSPRPPVTESAPLESYAATGAMYDFTNGPHAHFMTDVGGGIAGAENECPQQGNWTIMAGEDLSMVVERCLAAFYMGGPGEPHYETIMGPYAKLGCGLFSDSGKITIVQDYGN